MSRARALGGRSIGDIAAQFGVAAPVDLRRNKGFVGQLIETALGATAKSRAAPDFELLGIELKTLPVDRRGRVLESTFVATAPLSDVGMTDWRQSRVFCKLANVLWVVVQGDRDLRVADRLVGASFFWSPSANQEAVLQSDWEEIAGIVGRGDYQALHGGIGTALQTRPKAANRTVTREAVDADGNIATTTPRGFYLRARFTQTVLHEALALG